ncbi:hypothetical protein SUSAZ_09930 [Sulfolobus acidocaldarius SUSAZ]|nr:hypothetical protein SUSAZ_09930 [Sulfolobus acidocaldarius SUSAZ]
MKVNKNKLKIKRGMSDSIIALILTIIGLIAVIAVVLFTYGLAGTIPRQEPVEVIGSGTLTGYGEVYNLTVTLKNSGTSDVNITSVWIANMKFVPVNPQSSILRAGQTQTMTFEIKSNSNVTFTKQSEYSATIYFNTGLGLPVVVTYTG